MYNTEIKQKYLDESIDRNANLNVLGVRAFNQIEEYERELDKDCCNFTIKEIIIYYQRRCSTSLDSLNTLNSIFKGYTNWCLQRNMLDDNQNHYLEVNADILNNCLNYGMVNDKIISRKDLLFIIKDFVNASDKALLLAIFEGICGNNMSELVNLKCEDIKKTKGTYIATLCSGRKLEISKELYNYCVQSQECYSHYAYNPKGIYERPYNPEDDSYFEDIPDERQDKLTGEDLMSLNMPQEAPPDSGGMPGMNEKSAKALKVGDIVWVRKVKKFGRIVSVDNGKFNVEEVIEKPCKVLDDSDNY